MDQTTEFRKWMEEDMDNPYRSPMRKTIVNLCTKWKVLVLYELARRDRTDFYSLRAAIPTITNTILSNTLQELMEDNIVYVGMPMPEEKDMMYGLTPKGQDLLPAFYELYRWALKYQPRPASKKAGRR